MSEIEKDVAAHYGSADLHDRIVAALAAAGKTAPTAADLKAVDEFHIGGLAATDALLAQLALKPGDRVLDIGSGIGGAARRIVETTGATVHGVDLTPDFVLTARRLCDLVGVAATFEVGSALDLPLEDASFDVATLLHVGMNIPDKPRLFAEAARVLRPGGVFAVYDVMRKGPGEMAYPLPWASTPEASFLAPPADYRDAAEAAGFEIVSERDRADTALRFFEEMAARIAQAGPPPVGLPLIMGATAKQKVANMLDNVKAGRIAPVEMICRKRG